MKPADFIYRGVIILTLVLIIQGVLKWLQSSL